MGSEMSFSSVSESTSSTEEKVSPLQEGSETETSPNLHGRTIQVTGKEKNPIRSLHRARSKSETDFEKEEKVADLSTKSIKRIKPQRGSGSKLKVTHKSSSSPRSPRLQEVTSPKHSPKSCSERTQQLRDIYKNLFQQSGVHTQISSCYLTISRALSHGIYYFLDDSGRLITLQDLDKLVVKKYGETTSELQSTIRKDVIDFFECNPHLILPEDAKIIKNLLRMNLPESSHKERKSEVNAEQQMKIRTCQSILLRLYPMSNPYNVESIHNSEALDINFTIV